MVESKYIKDFELWCQREHIKVTQNKEVFFIHQRKTLLPQFKLGTNVFVHIVDELEPEDEMMYQAFSKSFYTIIVIQKDIIPDLIKHFSKKDISKHFKINI
jgi:hypothetical protein